MIFQLIFVIRETCSIGMRCFSSMITCSAGEILAGMNYIMGCFAFFFQFIVFLNMFRTNVCASSGTNQLKGNGCPLARSTWTIGYDPCGPILYQSRKTLITLSLCMTTLQFLFILIRQFFSLFRPIWGLHSLGPYRVVNRRTFALFGSFVRKHNVSMLRKRTA